MDEELNFYTVDMKYVRNLKNVEKRATGRTNTILSVSSQKHKQGRPFLGIIVLVNEQKYCIPLSSIEEKPKFANMSENITFRKIKDEKNNTIGILNINNMIPVREKYISYFNINELSEDTPDAKKYKEKCQAELNWCRSNKKQIYQLANNLYNCICSNDKFKKRDICPNYIVLERECNKDKTISKRNVKKQKQWKEGHLKELKQNGFQPSRRIISAMERIDKAYGKYTNLQTISDIYKGKEPALTPEIKSCAKEIGDSLKAQELSRVSYR